MKDKLIGKIIALTVLILFVIIFRSWFTFESISTGDWTYKFTQSIAKSPLYFYAWDVNFNKGMGSNIIFLLPLSTYSQAIPALLFSVLNVTWVILEKIVWYFPFLLISIVSSFYFFKKIILNDNLLGLISALIFTTNTYILLTVGGGQIGVGTAYALMPLVAYGFINILNKTELKDKINASIIAGIMFSIELMIDSRIAYVLTILIIIYYLAFIFQDNIVKALKSSLAYFVLLPSLVMLLLNFFWLIPFVLIGKNPLSNLGGAYTDPNMVTYLSFAKFENTISLLHPNWPENIFGKVFFMRPEFLIIPIIAFLAIVLLNYKSIFEKRIIIVFSLTALIGAFLAKGASEPFGALYVWIFNHVPGFIMFRDSTKWYGLIAISYSVLIPYSIYLISQRYKIFSKNFFIILFLIIWVILSREAVFGHLSGTFISRQVPSNYIELAKFISSENSFYRIMWVPNFTQFSYYSQINPLIPANDFYGVYSEPELIKKINLNKNLISLWGVKYIIVPDDIQGKIFVTDRVYDESIYKKTVKDLEKLNFIQKKVTFGKIVVFEVLNPKDHFWTNSENLKLKYQYISPVEYKLELNNAKKGDVIVFAENFDAKWVANTTSGTKYYISSIKYDVKFNSFVLPKDGSYSLRVYYKPQDYVNIGLVVSGISLSVILGTLLILKLKKK